MPCLVEKRLRRRLADFSPVRTRATPRPANIVRVRIERAGPASLEARALEAVPA